MAPTLHLPQLASTTTLPQHPTSIPISPLPITAAETHLIALSLTAATVFLITLTITIVFIFRSNSYEPEEGPYASLSKSHFSHRPTTGVTESERNAFLPPVFGKYPYRVPSADARLRQQPQFRVRSERLARTLWLNGLNRLRGDREWEFEDHWVDVEDGAGEGDASSGDGSTNTRRGVGMKTSADWPVKMEEEDERTPLLSNSRKWEGGKMPGEHGYGIHTRVLELREEAVQENVLESGSYGLLWTLKELKYSPNLCLRR